MFNPIDSNLERYMTLVSARQKVVASNIANADTPGYKTKDIDFQSELNAATAELNPVATEVQGLRVKNDGNNVNLDRESRLLAENNMRFSIASQFMRSQIKGIKSAIDGGGSAS